MDEVQSRAAAECTVADVVKAASVVAALHGQGGQPKKRRRLARQLGGAIDRSRQPALGLKELAEPEDGSDELMTTD